MTEEYRYDVEILHLLVSPSHAYFGRARDGAADVPTFDAETAEVVAGKGIVGDRFFGKAAHMDAAVTLFAVESLEAIAAELGAEPFNPLLTGRGSGGFPRRPACPALRLDERDAGPRCPRLDAGPRRHPLPCPLKRNDPSGPCRAGQPGAAGPIQGG
jgi:hypothetical protein